MAAKEILKKAFDCKCNECSHSWITQEIEMPKTCPSCKSSDWNTVWQKSEQTKNIAQLSDFEKKQIERQMLNQSYIKQAERRARRRIIATKE